LLLDAGETLVSQIEAAACLFHQPCDRVGEATRHDQLTMEGLVIAA